jgi:hypothetical protein
MMISLSRILFQMCSKMLYVEMLIAEDQEDKFATMNQRCQ